MNLFGFEDILRPQALTEIPGCWLGNNKKAIVHLISVEDATPSTTNGIDHIGLLMTNQIQFLSRLKSQDITPLVIGCQEKKRKHIYVKTPCGTTIEAIFDKE